LGIAKEIKYISLAKWLSQNHIRAKTRRFLTREILRGKWKDDIMKANYDSNMNFTIPQFIEMESKIVGPLTFKQFIFVGIGTTISFVIYFVVGKASMPLALAMIAIVGGCSGALAFVKIDGIDIIKVIEHYIAFARSPRMFLWQGFSLPNQQAVDRGTITLQKAPTMIKITASSKKNNWRLIRDYIETA